jgi:hypothetical protein
MRCDSCATPIHYGERVIVLRIGVEVPCRKKHVGTYFKSYQFDDGKTERVFHQSCVREAFDLSDADDHHAMMNCMFCNNSLPAREMFFQFLPGTTKSSASEEPKISIDQVNHSYVKCFFACYDCVIVGFAEFFGAERDAYETLGMEVPRDIDPVESDIRRYAARNDYDNPPRRRR